MPDMLASNEPVPAAAIPLRKGTGTRRSGRVAAEHILSCAQSLLADGHSAQFSMRNVAQKARVHLANVQYYFPTRDDLIHALVRDVGRRYREAYQRCLAASPPDRIKRFESVLSFNLQDIGLRSTRRYFVQLWALLDRLDGNSGRRMSELYAIDIAQLSERIAEIDPHARAAEVRRRATLLAALIEGLMIVHGAPSARDREHRTLMKQARKLGLSIALGRMNERYPERARSSDAHTA